MSNWRDLSEPDDPDGKACVSDYVAQSDVCDRGENSPTASIADSVFFPLAPTRAGKSLRFVPNEQLDKTFE